MAAPLDLIGRYELLAPSADAEAEAGFFVLYHGHNGQEWLPGQFATRDAALLAVGIAVGRGSHSTLSELCEHVLHDLNRWVTVEDIISFVANKDATS